MELGVTVLHYGLSPWQGLGIEIMLTFLLVFTVSATQDPNRTEVANKALVIGLAVAGCHLAGYRFTGSSMNPARSLGPAFVAGKWGHHWIYWAGPTIGGVAAGLLYEFIFDPSRTRARSHVPASVDTEEGLATTSLTTANPAHFITPTTTTTTSTTTGTGTTCTPRHYYNSSPTVSSNHNLLGSPRSCRRDPLAVITPSTNTNFNSNSGGAFTNTSVPGNTTSSSSVSAVANHYVPGTYGERSLIDIRDPHRGLGDVIAAAPPVPRRNDAPPRPRGLSACGQGASSLTLRRHADDVTPGRENEAYTFDSNPRRLQSPNHHQHHHQLNQNNSNHQHSLNTHHLQQHANNMLGLFDDGRETICLNDVRVF